MIKLVIYFAILLASLPLMHGQEVEETAAIKVSINNLSSQEGKVAINIFVHKDGFPSNLQLAYLNKTFEIDSDQPEFIFENVPIGNYSLAVIHDENSNSKIDKDFFGRPKEGYAVSNNVKASMFAPPKFSDALFEHTASGTNLKLKILY